jgi:amino acid permease
MVDETIEPEPVCHTITEYILFKLDRNLAVLGIIAIAIASIFYFKGSEGIQIVSGAVGGLVAYISGRSSK